MIGISKKELEDMLRAESRLDIKIALNFIIQHCHELDPWLPIDDAPKDRYIRVFAPAYDDLPSLQQVCKWHESAGFCIDELRTPTHYKELDDEPKILDIIKTTV